MTNEEKVKFLLENVKVHDTHIFKCEIVEEEGKVGWWVYPKIKGGENIAETSYVWEQIRQLLKNVH